jgi:tRNA (guanosine-2'-O-)-methyltransferase
LPACLPALRDDRYKVSSRSAAGADKWLDVRVWEGGSAGAIGALKAAGFQLVVTHLGPASVSAADVDFVSRPTAIVLVSTERSGSGSGMIWWQA